MFTPDSHFVTNPIINLWSSLPCSTVTASTASCLKRKLDKFFSYRFIIFNPTSLSVILL